MFLFPFDPTTLPATLAGFLALLASSAGYIASWIFSNVPWFADVPDWAKQVFASVLGILLTGLFTWFTSMASPDTVAHLNAWYLLIIQALITIAGTALHGFAYKKVVKPLGIWVGHKTRVPSGSQG